MTPVVVLDTGALLAVEKGRSALMRDLQRLALRGRVQLIVSSGVVAQAWRDPSRQVRMVRLLRSDAVTEVALDSAAARRIGLRLASLGGSDVVDGHVAQLADRLDAASVVTSDPDDLGMLGLPRARLVAV